jgi:uncharacterized protein YunC (DUF1805 family)
MSTGNEYLIPLGVDLGPLVSSLRESRALISDVDKTSKAASQNMQQSFAVVAETQKKVTQTAIEYNRATKQNAADTQKLAESFGDLGQSSSKIFQEFSKQGQEGVKKVSQLIDGLEKKLQQLRSASQRTLDPQLVDKYNVSIKKTEAEVGQLYQALDQLQESGHVLDEFAAENDKVTVKSKSLKAQLRELKNELAALEEQGQEGTQRFEDLSIAAGHLEDQIGDTQQRIRGLASDTKYIDATIQAVTAVTAGFGIAQGVVGLFGDENKELAKALQKVTSVMAILQGLQTVQNLMQKQNILAILTTRAARTAETATTVAHAEAVAVDAVATEGATVATKGFTAALIANPIGLILVGLGALIAVLSSLGDGTEEAAEKQQKLNDEYDKFIAAVRVLDEMDALRKSNREGGIDATKRELDILKSSNATKGQIFVKEQQLRDAELHAINTKLAVNKLDLQDAKARGVAEEKINDLIKNRLELQADASNKQAEITAADKERNVELYQDSLKSATALADAKVILEREGSRKRLDAEIASVKTSAREQLANVNLTEGERYKIQVQSQKKIEELWLAYDVTRLNNRKALIEADLALVVKGSKEELDLRISQSDTQRDIEVKSAKGNFALVEKAEKESQQRRIEFTKEYNRKVAEDTINSRILSLQTDIANMTAAGLDQTSEEFMKAKRGIINEQANLDILAAENTITNEELKQKKILEITAKANADVVELEKQKFIKIQDEDHTYWKGYLDLQASRAQRLIADETQSTAERQKAIDDFAFFSQQSLKSQEAYEKDRYEKGIITLTEYNTKINDLTKSQEDLDQSIKDLNASQPTSFLDKATHDVDAYINKLLEATGLSKSEVKKIKEAFKDLFKEVSNLYKQSIDEQIAAKEKQISELSNQVEKIQSELDKELDAQKNGYANNVAAKQAEIAAIKAERAKAVEDERKLQKQRALIASAEIAISTTKQTVELGEAAAKIFKAHAGIPFVGVILALAAVATMMTGFLSIKNQIKSAQDSVPSFDRGGGLELNGPDHSQGGLDVVEKKSGKVKANVRGGEYMYVFKHTDAKKYQPVFDAINDNYASLQVGSLLKEIGGVHLMEDVPQVIMPVVQQHSEDEADYRQALLDNTNNSKELQNIYKELKDFKESWKEEPRVIDYGDYMEITIGNYTKRIIKKKPE